MNRYVSEMIGTMILVLMGCGSAVFAGDMPGAVTTGVGTLGVAIAFGLSVVAMAYAIGGISGCHINPAITHWACTAREEWGARMPCYTLFSR